MKQLSSKSQQTPIEIALGIDENGMTTARTLYKFLELANGQFSRWCKANILDNQFAEEGIDYIGFDVNVEGNETKDYKLKSEFAKKLSMTAKNDKGEQARDYFVKSENKLKEFALNLSGLSPELQAIFAHDKKIQAVIEHMEQSDNRLDHIENTMVIDYGQQLVLKDKVNSRCTYWLGGKESNAYNGMAKKLFSECNKDIQHYFNVNSRNNIPRIKFEDAVKYIENWEPCYTTKLLIQDWNSQINMDEPAM